MINIILGKIHMMHFCDGSYRTRFINISNYDLDNLDQDYVVQQWQWSHLMANINLYKNHILGCFSDSHRFRDSHI